MHKAILHSSFLELYLYVRSKTHDDPYKAPLQFIDTIYKTIEDITCFKGIQMYIPSFDYQTFQEKKFNPFENRTNFGLARFIFDNIESKYFDIYNDPVFSYLIYPGVGQIYEESNLYFRPFQDDMKLLQSSDYLVFTRKAFQPSHLMELEYRFFNNRIPYRYTKEFKFENHMNSLCSFNFNVRPLNDELCNYDLEKLKVSLISKNILKDTSSIFNYCNLGDLTSEINSCLENDPLYLMTLKSKSMILSMMKNFILPESCFV